MSLIATILPPGVASCEILGQFAEAGELFPVEEQSLGRCVHKRRQEFAAGRGCARTALQRLGHARTTIPRGANREPIWPPGVVGSITHCRDYRAAAVASESSVQTIGMDAEPNESLPAGVLHLIASATEVDLLASLPAARVCWDRLLFSVKESLYKAWFPLERRWLGFEDVRVMLQPDGTFLIKILKSASVRMFREDITGRFVATETHLITALALPQIETWPSASSRSGSN